MARDFSKKFTDSYIYGIKPTGAKIWRFIYTHPITKNALKNLFGIIHQFHLLSLEIRLVYGEGYWHKV